VTGQPVSRAQEDAPALCPKPGDPGTRTVELHDAAGKVTQKVALRLSAPHPGIILVGERGFVLGWQGVYVEKVVAKMQGHA
jgi:hypothetical protein